MGFTVSFSLPSFQSFAVLRLHCIVYVQTVCFQALFPGGVLASLPELRNGERIPPVASLDSKTTVQWFPVQMILSPRRHWQRLETLLIIMAGGRGLPAGSEQKPCIPWKESSGWNGHHHPTPHYMAEQVLTLLWTLNSGLNEQENHLVLFYSLPGFLWNPAPLVELKESLFQVLPATGGGKPQGLACQVPTIQAQSEMLRLLWFTAKSAFCFPVWGWCDTRFIWLKKKMLSSFFFFPAEDRATWLHSENPLRFTGVSPPESKLQGLPGDKTFLCYRDFSLWVPVPFCFPLSHLFWERSLLAENTWLILKRCLGNQYANTGRELWRVVFNPKTDQLWDLQCPPRGCLAAWHLPSYPQMLCPLHSTGKFWAGRKLKFAEPHRVLGMVPGTFYEFPHFFPTKLSSSHCYPNVI